VKDYFRNFFCSFSFQLIPITVLLFCSTILLIINGTGYSIDNFSVLERNIVIDQSGFIHLFGEIRNTSNEPQRSITANANFYDKNGQNIGNGSGIVSLRSLNTGQVSPFEIIFLDKNQTKHFFNYTLNFTSGRLSNMGNDTATNVLAIASFFDSNGKIIGLSSAITEPSNMTSHSTASFTVVMDDKIQSPKIKNYSLTVDSDQYASK